MVLCDYGCSQEAKYQFKNGKWCCSKNWHFCLVMRKKNSDIMKEVTNRLEEKENRSKLRKEEWKDPEKRKNRIAAIKESWKDPEKRKNRIDTQNRLEVKERKSKVSEEVWNRPGIRAKIVRAMKESWEDPKVRKKQSKAIKDAWEDPQKRKNILDAIKGVWDRSEVRDKVSGSNHYNWNSNREEVFTPYTEKFYDLEFRDQIKREQSYIDPVTGYLLTKRACLHHINYNKQDDERINLIWLNHKTHVKTNTNREEWKNFLSKINRGNILDKEQLKEEPEKIAV